jgi:hypothetical protein
MMRTIFPIFVALALLLFGQEAFGQSRRIVPGDVGIQTPFGAVGNVLVAGPGTSQIQDSSNCGSLGCTLPSKLYLNVGSYTPSSVLGTVGALGVFVNEAVTGNCGGFCSFNYMNMGSDNVTAGPGAGPFANGSGWYFNHNFGGAAATGNRLTGIFNLLVNSTTGNTAANASYSGLGVYTTATVNDNGTGTGSGLSRGQVEALNVIAKLQGTATNWSYLQSAEFNVAVATGSSVRNKEGIAIVQLSNDAVAGVNIDAALLITNQVGAVGWNTGILFGGPGWPFQSTATAIGCTSPCGVLTNFIDMSAATISDSFLKGPGFTVSGTGTVSGTQLIPTGSTLPANGIYAPAANQMCMTTNSTNGACVTYSGGGVGSGLVVGGTGVVNPGDKFAFTQAGLNSRNGATFANTSTGTASQVSLILGNSTSVSQASMILNGGGFSGGCGANCLHFQNGGADALTISSSQIVALPAVATGTPVASLCIDASNNIIKKTTAGSCI